MTQYFDDRETQEPVAREAELFKRLPKFLTAIKATIPAWSAQFGELECATISSREKLTTLPILRKSDLMQAQQENPPFGGFVNSENLQGSRIFMSPGPIWEPQPPGIDPWLAARAFYAAGIRKSDIIHIAISYHLTPGGFILDEGARALGAQVFPAGTGNTQTQVEAAAFLKSTVYAGTPDYLKTLLDKADEIGNDLSSISKALVSGGALFPSMRDEYNSRGVNVMQAYATADLGVIAYESAVDGAPVPGMVCNEDLIVEIVRPGTGDPVPNGEVGELVVTNFNENYPLVRFATGDLSAVLDEPSPCGRTNLRIQGWMGRADQRTKVKGMFVDPKQIDEILRSNRQVKAARLVITRENDADHMCLQMVANDGEIDLISATEQLQAITKLRGTAEQVQSLPNDGKIIDDQRDYSK